MPRRQLPEIADLPTSPATSEGMVEWATQLTDALHAQFADILDSMRNGISVEDSLDGEVVDVTSPASSKEIEFPVRHGLGRIPTFFMVMSASKPSTVYKGVQDWTSDNVYLRATNYGVKLKLFIG